MDPPPPHTHPTPIPSPRESGSESWTKSALWPTVVFIHSGGFQATSSQQRPSEGTRSWHELPSNHLPLLLLAPLAPPLPPPPRQRSVGDSLSREGHGYEGHDGLLLQLSCARIGAARQ